ncbi:MAG: sigma 54-interacting transcriptional regulator, partial [Myxococcota bacterium]
KLHVDRAPEIGARLIVVEGTNPGATLIVSRARHTVGRHPTNDLVLDDPSVSLVHLEVHRTGSDQVVIRDAESTNGTWLGEHRIQEAQLAPGAVLTVGQSKLRVESYEGVSAVAKSDATRFEGLVGQSAEMRELFAVLERIAPKNLSVLFEGETGTGKEEAARALHTRSRRRRGPFVVLDAATIPPSLAESMLFGHEQGAFPGAETRQVGAFERASGGTILIDEIGELPLGMQSKLLRVLERREIVRLGAKEMLPVDVRVVAATHRDLRQEVEAGRFRDDLYFRIAQVRIAMPPLRLRTGDIPLLARYFLETGVDPTDAPVGLSDEAMAELVSRPWPGNARELRNVLMRAAALCDGSVIEKEDIGAGGFGFKDVEDDVGVRAMITGPFSEAKAAAIARFEQMYLKALMARTRGNLSRASRESGIARNHLRDLLRKRGLYHT